MVDNEEAKKKFNKMGRYIAKMMADVFKTFSDEQILVIQDRDSCKIIPIKLVDNGAEGEGLDAINLNTNEKIFFRIFPASHRVVGALISKDKTRIPLFASLEIDASFDYPRHKYFCVKDTLENKYFVSNTDLVEINSKGFNIIDLTENNNIDITSSDTRYEFVGDFISPPSVTGLVPTETTVEF